MTKYIVAHCKHDGCYNFKSFQDESSKTRITSIKINPPKIFLFETKVQAHFFFNEYINDVDAIDVRCKKSEDEIEHINYCTCGIIEVDENDNPSFFYNKTNQIFLLEIGAQTFLTTQSLKKDISNMNLTNKLIKNCKSLDLEQKKKYIELGKVCQECLEFPENNYECDGDDGNNIVINKIN